MTGRFVLKKKDKKGYLINVALDLYNIGDGLGSIEKDRYGNNAS